jgi:hypothetical protein
MIWTWQHVLCLAVAVGFGWSAGCWLLSLVRQAIGWLVAAVRGAGA